MMREPVGEVMERLAATPASRGTVKFNLEVGRLNFPAVRRRLHEVAAQLDVNLIMTTDKGLLVHWVSIMIEGTASKMRTFLLFVEAMIDANRDEEAA